MMTFLLANAGVLSVVGVGLALFALGFILAPYLNKKGVGAKALGGTADGIKILEDVVGHMNLGSVQSKTQMILHLAEVAVRYVEQTMEHADSNEKKDIAVQTATEILGTVGVQVTDEEKKLLDIGIESAVNKLPIAPVVNVTNSNSTDSVKEFVDQIKRIGSPLPVIPAPISPTQMPWTMPVISSTSESIDKVQGS